MISEVTLTSSFVLPIKIQWLESRNWLDCINGTSHKVFMACPSTLSSRPIVFLLYAYDIRCLLPAHYTSATSFLFFFFLVGKGGNASCTIAPERGCGGLHQGSPNWPRAFGRKCPVSYPLKPPFAGVPAASLYVKLICGPANRSNLLSFFSAQSFRSFFCFFSFLSSSMKRVAFQLFVNRSVNSPFSICVVSLGVTS